MVTLHFDTISRQYIQVNNTLASEKQVLNLALRKRAEGYMFQQRYKKKIWDGYDKFLKPYHKHVDETTGKKTEKFHFGIGLWQEAIKALEENGCQYEIDNIDELIDRNIDQVKLNNFVELLLDGVVAGDGSPMAPRDYQFEAAYRALKYKYCTQELATSAGKTIIFYIYICYLKAKKHINKNGKKALIVVPQVGLLNQTYDAFVQEYNNDLIALNIMRLGSKFKYDEKKFKECDVLISTYQSLANVEIKDFYQNFNVICIDEAHTSKSPSIQAILKSSTKAQYRFGLSGTISIKSEFSNLYRVLELLGPLRMIVTSAFLQEQGYSPNIRVKMLQLIHPYSQEIKFFDDLRAEYKNSGLPTGYTDPKAFGKAMFELEKQYLYSSERRLEVIANLVNKLQGNTLILFNNVKDGYGVRIQESLLKTRENVFYVDGGVNVDNRADYQRCMEANEGVVIVASYGTFSTGLNIKRLHNIIFAESSKSEITIRQSIGRGMRKFFEKNLVFIYDLCDQFEDAAVQSYMASHAEERERIYKTNAFVYTKHTVKL